MFFHLTLQSWTKELNFIFNCGFELLPTIYIYFLFSLFLTYMNEAAEAIRHKDRGV